MIACGQLRPYREMNYKEEFIHAYESEGLPGAVARLRELAQDLPFGPMRMVQSIAMAYDQGVVPPPLTDQDELPTAFHKFLELEANDRFRAELTDGGKCEVFARVINAVSEILCVYPGYFHNGVLGAVLYAIEVLTWLGKGKAQIGPLLNDPAALRQKLIEVEILSHWDSRFVEVYEKERRLCELIDEARLDIKP